MMRARDRLLRCALGLAVALLAACGGGGGQPEPAAQALQSVVVHNPGNHDVRFNLAINGKRFFANDDDVLDELQATLAPNDDAGFAMALWRFMLLNRYHYEPYTAQQWGHAPTLFLNSLGYGLCDDIAAATSALARRRGLAARVWFLNGHIVAEIRVANRWQVYDADLEVYYRLRDGRLGGVEELAGDTTLISNPVEPLPVSAWMRALQQSLPPDAADIAPGYAPAVADAYGTAHDNWVEPWYDDFPLVGAAEPPLLLPAGASLSISSALNTTLLSFNGVAIPRAATMSLQLADGWSGTLSLPLLVVDVQGSGRLRIDGEDFDAGSAALRARLADRSRAVASVQVLRAEQALTLVLAINAQRFALDQLQSVELLGERAQSLTVTRRFQAPGS